VFADIRVRLDYSTYGGAPLLGVRGNCIVAHGRSDRTAIRNAIRQAAAVAGADLVGSIGAVITA
jgi:glycerol-3-phosphate acyltransferase PlsX